MGTYPFPYSPCCFPWLKPLTSLIGPDSSLWDSSPVYFPCPRPDMQRFAAQLASSRLLQDTELGSFTGSLLCTASDGTNAPWHQNRPYDGHLLVLSSQHLFFIPITDSPFPDPVYPRYYSGVSTSPRPGQSEHSISRVISSIQFSHSVMSDSLRPHGLQHARPPCPSSTPGVYSNACP